MFVAIKGDFEMYGEGLKPLKATGTCWIDHCICAMGRLVDKIGLYARHMKDFIYKEKNSKTKATVEGKLEKLLDARVLLRSASLKESLVSLTSSLVTQLHMIETVEDVEKTKRNCKRLLKKVQRDSN